MRILHVINTLRTGGAEKLVSEIVPLMISDGFHVEVVTFIGEETQVYQSLLEAGVKVHIFSKTGSVYNPLHIVKLRRLIKNFDIIHSHNTSPQLFCAMANWHINKHLVTTEHGGSNRRRAWKWFLPIDKIMYNCYSKIICVSDKTEEDLRKYLNSTSDAIITISNGINISRFKNAESNKELLQLKSGGIKIISMVAGFRWEKDQDTLIKAISSLPSNFHLFLVGQGPRMNECIRLSKIQGVENRVHFLGLRADIPMILKASDYICMSSHFEGLSLSSLEGMASGNPFVASDVAGLREIVLNNGILFPPKNHKALAELILQLDNDENLRNYIVEKCQKKASNYDITKTVKKYETVYKNLTEI